jgi:hypothetical protein
MNSARAINGSNYYAATRLAAFEIAKSAVLISSFQI